MEKDFASWHKIKAGLQKSKGLPVFKEREIWWCSVGVNVGDEEDGKNTLFTRPVLVVRKFNKKIFWGVPLTTQIKDNPYYHKFYFNGKEQCAMLTQLRLFDNKRLTKVMGKILPHQAAEIRAALRGCIP